MAEVDVRSDTPIRRARLPLADPILGIEAPWVAWVAAAAAGVPSALTAFWTVYGLITLAGSTPVAAAILGAAGGVCIGGSLALLVGVAAAKVITTETPLRHHLAVFVSELSAPQRPDRVVRRRLPLAPAELSAPRRGSAPLPPHFEQENACVRPECVGPSTGRDDRDP